MAPSERAADARTLVATGPGLTEDGESFRVRLAWNDPSLAPGESRWGHLLIGASDAQPDGVAQVLVKLTRARNGQSGAAALIPGATRSMRLLGGLAQDRLYLEVPPGATRLRVRSQGSGEVKLYLAHDAQPSSPSIASAPARSSATAVSTQPGANDEVEVSGSALRAGRWYVTPVNEGIGAADFDLVVSLDFDRDRPQPGYGNWFDPDRPGSGFFLSPFAGGEVWTVAWYTFLQDGTPTWLGGSLPAPGARQPVASFELYRFTWNGEQPHGVVVGNATLSLIDARTMQVSYNLDGESGSQRLQLIEPAESRCQALPGGNLKPDGNWYVPSRSGFGFEVLGFPNLETYLAYVYDGRGIARWVMAYREASVPQGELHALPAQLMTGACPLCTMGAATSTEVGVIRRRFVDATHARMGADLRFPEPMTGQWKNWDDTVMLTSPIPCQ